MKYRRLGSIGLKVPAIALGSWTFGWSVDQATSSDLLSTAMDAGSSFIDTADRYGRPTSPAGTAESMIGRWLASQIRGNVIIATKVRGQMGAGPNDVGLSRKYIMQAVEASLKRLRTDYIDLYQIHWPDSETPLEETLSALNDLVR